MGISNIRNQKSKIAFGLLFLIFGFLLGCSHLKEYSQTKRRLSAISTGNLKGMSKVDIVKKFGQPLATSKSGVSACWYYAKPCEMWVWFDKDDKVERWEAK